MRLHLLVCLGADFDRAYIPHLCRHYAPAVDSWTVLLHSNDPGEAGERAIEKAKRIFESTLVDLSPSTPLDTREWRGEFSSLGKVARLNDAIGQTVPIGDWVMYIDADEFIESADTLKSLVAQCTADGRKVVYGHLVDRFAPGRKPYPINDEDDLFIKFPCHEPYTLNVLRGCIQKPCLMRYDGELLLPNCHEYSGQNWAEYVQSGGEPLTIWHFKWVASTRDKLVHRLDSYRRQGVDWWKESAIGLKDIYGEETGESWRPRRLGTVYERDGEELTIQLGESSGVRLNPTAALIWQRCDGTRTEADILAELCGQFGVPEDSLQSDIRAALEGLTDVGALEPDRQKQPGPRSLARDRLRLGLVSETSPAFLNQVKLCLYSLRRNGGALSELPVTLITNSEPLSEQETGFLQEHFAPIEFRTSPRLGAIRHTSKLNVFYSIDPATYDVLMFMDCDTVVRQPLDRIVDPILYEGAQFVCRRGGKTDRNRFVDFSDLVSRYCGHGRTNKVLYEGRKEWPMFNSGVFLATSDAVIKIRRFSIEFTYRLFNEWQRNNALEQLPEHIRNQIEINQVVREDWPIEQGALALACINSGVNVQYLDGTYNSWGGEEDFSILHCFKSLYQFDRRSMYAAGSEKWISEYLESDIPGKVFLASTIRDFKRDFPKLS